MKATTQTDEPPAEDRNAVPDARREPRPSPVLRLLLGAVLTGAVYAWANRYALIEHYGGSAAPEPELIWLAGTAVCALFTIAVTVSAIRQRWLAGPSEARAP